MKKLEKTHSKTKNKDFEKAKGAKKERRRQRDIVKKRTEGRHIRLRRGQPRIQNINV